MRSVIVVGNESPIAPSSFKTKYESWINERKDGFEELCRKIQDDLKHKYGESFQGVSYRIKGVGSAYLKVCKGKVHAFTDLNDLFGLKLIMLRRADVDDALSFLKSYKYIECIDDIDFRKLEPSDFSYREPKILVREARKGVLDKNPALRDMCIEIQVTTSLQHALDISTHNFDYKGKNYSWQNFRKVARIRAMVESIELEIDRIAANKINSEFDRGAIPERFNELENLEKELRKALPKEEEFPLPRDLVRFLEIIQKWMILFEMEDADLCGLINDKCKSILDLRSLTVMEKMLACFVCIKEPNDDLWRIIRHKIDSADIYLPISSSLVQNAEYLRNIPSQHWADV